MNKYDIVFCDIDDTLNPSNGITTEYTREVMKKLKDKGLIFKDVESAKKQDVVLNMPSKNLLKLD